MQKPFQAEVFDDQPDSECDQNQKNREKLILKEKKSNITWLPFIRYHIIAEVLWYLFEMIFVLFGL